MTDNIGVTGYYVSTSSSTPSTSASGWTTVSSTTSFWVSLTMTISSSGSGYRNVYAWFKDASGNVSYRNSDSMYCSEYYGYCY